MSKCIETMICPDCGRQGCFTISDADASGNASFEEYTCKCGHSEYMEWYDCPAHGKFEGGECPEC